MESRQVRQLLEEAALRREKFGEVSDAVRLVNGFGDGMEGFILEKYGRHFMAQVFEPHWLVHAQVILDFLTSRFNAEYVIVKERSASASSEPGAMTFNMWLDGGSSQTIVSENGLKFAVDLNDTLNSGLFLDMRRNRALVAGFADGKKVLNCFAYTCSFGVYCRAKGASSVVNVDVSKKSLERGRRNYELNGLVPAPNEFIRADAVAYLERAVKKENRFDMIILDPPSFARHEGRSFSVKKDLAPLIERAVTVLNPGGILFVASNYSLMGHVNIEDMIMDAAGRRTVKSMDRFGQDDDFEGSGSMQESYLAAVLAEIA